MHRPAPSLRGRALQWLAQRDHSRQELHDKLLRWLRSGAPDPNAGPDADRDVAADAQAVESLLDELQAAGHLSQSRFIESRIHARAGRFGNRRIEQELRRLGAEPDPQAREALKASEPERAREVWLRRFGRPPASLAERAKQMRFLAGRGFSADAIRRVLGGDAESDPLAGE